MTITITITPTEEFFLINDSVPGRIWDGVTEAGVPCRVLVAGVFLPEGAATADFDEALREHPVTVLEPLDPETN